MKTLASILSKILFLQTSAFSKLKVVQTEIVYFCVAKSDNTLWHGTSYASPTLSQVSCSNLSTVDIIHLDDKLTLSPNPVNNELRINVGNNIIKQIIITDLTGKKLMSWDSNLSTIQLTDLSSGVYIIQVKTEDKILHAKFIKE